MYFLGHIEDMHITLSLFRKVFYTNFNISFATTAVDECSTCLSLQHKISVKKNYQEKDDLKLKLKCHKREAKFFFDHLKQKRDDVICYHLTDRKILYSRKFLISQRIIHINFITTTYQL